MWCHTQWTSFLLDPHRNQQLCHFKLYETRLRSVHISAAFLSPHETVDMRAWTSTHDSCVSSSYRYFVLCTWTQYTMTMQNNNITSDATYFKSQIAPTNQTIVSVHWTPAYTTKMLDITQQRSRRIYRKIITVPGKEYQNGYMCVCAICKMRKCTNDETKKSSAQI